ncbi:MAG: helix-turn-helix domain-containing protein [Clostridiales bacterium]|nr:helix-turn-helix domain-containing protein [Clostridiales bacterium]
MQQEEALTAAEASKILGVGMGQLREWMSKPYFPSVRVGKRDYIIFRTTLMHWISDPQNMLAFKQAQNEEDCCKDDAE